MKGCWAYGRLSGIHATIKALNSWIRQHIRKYFWFRWHSVRGRLRNLRRLGLKGKALGVASAGRGAWGVAKQPELHKALNNTALGRVFLFPSVLAAN